MRSLKSISKEITKLVLDEMDIRNSESIYIESIFNLGGK